MECGKHDILPVAGAILDHARVPVMLPRQSDADMRRDGSTTAQTVPIPPSMSAEECTAHQDQRAGTGSTRWCSGGRPVSRNSASSDTVEHRRRRWPRRERDPRLRGRDKRPCHGSRQTSDKAWLFPCMLVGGRADRPDSSMIPTIGYAQSLWLGGRLPADIVLSGA